jgi:hypothetical protein
MPSASSLSVVIGHTLLVIINLLDLIGPNHPTYQQRRSSAALRMTRGARRQGSRCRVQGCFRRSGPSPALQHRVRDGCEPHGPPSGRQASAEQPETQAAATISELLLLGCAVGAAGLGGLGMQAGERHVALAGLARVLHGLGRDQAPTGRAGGQGRRLLRDQRGRLAVHPQAGYVCPRSSKMFIRGVGQQLTYLWWWWWWRRSGILDQLLQKQQEEERESAGASEQVPPHVPPTTREPSPSAESKVSAERVKFLMRTISGYASSSSNEPIARAVGSLSAKSVRTNGTAVDEEQRDSPKSSLEDSEYEEDVQDDDDDDSSWTEEVSGRDDSDADSNKGAGSNSKTGERVPHWLRRCDRYGYLLDDSNDEDYEFQGSSSSDEADSLSGDADDCSSSADGELEQASGKNEEKGDSGCKESFISSDQGAEIEFRFGSNGSENGSGESDSTNELDGDLDSRSREADGELGEENDSLVEADASTIDGHELESAMVTNDRAAENLTDNDQLEINRLVVDESGDGDNEGDDNNSSGNEAGTLGGEVDVSSSRDYEEAERVGDEALSTEDGLEVEQSHSEQMVNEAASSKGGELDTGDGSNESNNPGSDGEIVEDSQSACESQQFISIWAAQEYAALNQTLREAMYSEIELEEERKQLQARLNHVAARVEAKRAEVCAIKLLLDERERRSEIQEEEAGNYHYHTGENANESDGRVVEINGEIVHEVDSTQSGDEQDGQFVRQEIVPSLLGDFSTTLVENEILSGENLNRGRHLCINPCNPSAIATSGLAGGLEIWGYSHTPRTLSRIALLDPTSFRSKMQTVAAIAWSPEGTNIAMGFEYPHDGKAEFCVVQLAGFKPLEDAKTPQVVPKDRVSLVTSRTHRHGLSSIAWVPSLAGQATRQLATTGRAEKDAVVLWSEREWSEESQSCWHEHALHSEQHQDSVQAMCIHSGQSAVFTGGRDGHVIRCSLQSGQTSTVMTAGSDDDALNVNAVLEHPTDPNILMISSVEVSQNRVVLHDLRQQYNGIRSAASVLVATSDVFATRRLHMQPRWSPTGVHVSCGGTGGVVSIWDIRSVASARAQPHQYLRLHCGTLAAFS